MVVQFSDPNVNKPLHIGHLRNNFIGMALSRIIGSQGFQVQREAIHTDWGVHICQALLSYISNEPATPESLDMKADHFVGLHYTRFHEEVARRRCSNARSASFDLVTGDLEAAAQDLLRRLTGKEQIALRAHYERLMAWADTGIRQTYARIGTDLDAVFYESQYVAECWTLVEWGLSKGLWARRADGSVFCNVGDGEVTLLRRDGTPVVYAQWIAVDRHRFADRDFDVALLLMGSEWRLGLATHPRAASTGRLRLRGTT